MSRKHISAWKNTSDYPDWFALPCLTWIMQEAGRDRQLAVEIRKGDEISGSGRAWVSRIFLRVRRRDPRTNWNYRGIRHDTGRETRGAIEAFVFLAAHEVIHTTAEGREWIRTLPHASMEFRTQSAAMRILEAWRERGRAEVMRKAKSMLKRERQKKATAERRKATAKAPETRLAALVERQKQWQSKAKRAQTALRKIARQIKGVERRIAAMRGGA